MTRIKIKVRRLGLKTNLPMAKLLARLGEVNAKIVAGTKGKSINWSNLGVLFSADSMNEQVPAPPHHLPPATDNQSWNSRCLSPGRLTDKIPCRSGARSARKPWPTPNRSWLRRRSSRTHSRLKLMYACHWEWTSLYADHALPQYRLILVLRITLVRVNGFLLRAV